MLRISNQKQQHTSHFGAMESGNHSKNGARPKSLMSRENFYLFAVFALMLSVFSLSSCGNDDPDDTYIYPETPTGVTAVKEGNSIKISWNAAKGADSYMVYRSTIADGFYGYYYDGYYTSDTYYYDDSPNTGKNYYKVRGSNYNGDYSDMSDYAVCDFIPDGGGDQTGLYLGIIGFNEQLMIEPIGLLTSGTRTAFTSFVNSMTSKNGTVLYYAVDNAIDALTTATLPSDLANVAIVTFTDGLDQGSHMLNGKYGGDNSAYLTAVNSRIKTVKVKGFSISAYSIGIKGNDVTDNAQFLVNLQSLASSNANATQVTSMTEVNTKFQEIAASLYNESSTQSMSLKIPGQANGTKIRFTFDNVADAATSTLYIEGTYSFADKKLTGVTYSGCSSTSGTTVSGTVDGIFVTYTFADIKQNSGAALPTTRIKQWNYVTASSQWQVNSEFTPEGNTNTIVDRKSAVIMLVLDCSSSLGAQFSTMQSNANAFINKMADGAQ